MADNHKKPMPKPNTIGVILEDQSKIPDNHRAVGRGDTVYLIGTGSIYDDVYIDRKEAEDKIIDYISNPIHSYIQELTKLQQDCIAILRSTGQPFEIIVDYYNSVADERSRWRLVEQELR